MFPRITKDLNKSRWRIALLLFASLIVAIFIGNFATYMLILLGLAVAVLELAAMAERVQSKYIELVGSGTLAFAALSYAILWLSTRDVNSCFRAIVLIQVISIGASDAVALWIGKRWGVKLGQKIFKSPYLMPSVSPNKTIIGALAGGTAGIILQTCGLLMLNYSALMAFAIAITAIVGGIIGDLSESKIKRIAGVKDSGTLLGAHGGFFDRIDALTGTSVAVLIIAYTEHTCF